MECECVRACEDVILIINLTNEKKNEKAKKKRLGGGTLVWVAVRFRFCPRAFFVTKTTT